MFLLNGRDYLCVTTEESGVPVRILLVEDNPDDAQMVELLLTRVADNEQQQMLLDVESFTHTDSLHRARAELEQLDPDIVLLDLDLPDSRGIETVERFEQLPQRPPFVVFTGHEETELGIQAIERGAQDYLYKRTLTRQVLFRTLRYALERHATQRDLAETTQRLALANRLLRQDLQNDLNIIIGEGDQLQGKHQADEKALGRILEASYRMLNKTAATAQLTETIVAGRTTSPKYNLVELLQEIAVELDGDRAIAIELSENNSNEWEPIITGKRTLRTALVEVLKNTIDRSQTVDDVSVTVSVTEETVAVTFSNDGRTVSSAQSSLLCDPDATEGELSTAGVGIQLASIVFNELGCLVSVDDNGPNGSVIRIEFERVRN